LIEAGTLGEASKQPDKNAAEPAGPVVFPFRDDEAGSRV
jgi:hypothetical protein